MYDMFGEHRIRKSSRGIDGTSKMDTVSRLLNSTEYVRFISEAIAINWYVELIFMIKTLNEGVECEAVERLNVKLLRYQSKSTEGTFY